MLLKIEKLKEMFGTISLLLFKYKKRFVSKAPKGSVIKKKTLYNFCTSRAGANLSNLKY